MSTITSPRDSSVNGRRIPLILATPTTSTRPSLETLRSTDASPNRGPSLQPKRNRAALREYYNLKKNAAADDLTSEASSIHDNNSDVPESELDRPGFDGEAYVKHVLETQSLGELLKTYNGILTDIRALDAEKKALVYDNYSKLIAATETIGRMRSNMEPLNPMAGTLDAVVRSIYERAERLKVEMRRGLEEEKGVVGREGKEHNERMEGVRSVVVRVLNTPERVRGLLKEGKQDEAKELWAKTLVSLQRWKERGVGGDDVQACIDDGDAALRGEPPNERSWVRIKGEREINS